MRYYYLLKVFLLTLIPTIMFAQEPDLDRGLNGAVERQSPGAWTAWGWFWVILLLFIVGFAIWYAVRAGATRGGGGGSSGTTGRPGIRGT